MMVAARRGDSSVGNSRFGDVLAAAANSIIADARLALTTHDASDTATVHEVRKAFKRWRALLRLLLLPFGEEAEQMRTEARELMRALAGARDAQSALDGLADLRKVEGSPTTSTSSTAIIRQRLIDLRDAAERESFTPEVRRRITQYLDLAAHRLDQWPLQKADLDAFADALTATYRRARRLVPDDWSCADSDHLHDLRRRVVEHRHQIELIEPLATRPGKTRIKEVQRLRSRLGACQDLAMLAKYTAPHQPLAPWRSRLTPAIEARRAEHLKTAEGLARRLFAEKPKAFRRRIAALSPGRAPTKAANDARGTG